METFEEYLNAMGDPEHKEKLTEILVWVKEYYPNLNTRIAWNQPMFTNEGTYIIGFSHSKGHISLAPEVKPIKEFKEEIEALGLSHTNNIIRIKWTDPTPFSLIDTLIKYNLEDKAGYTKFWR